MLFVILELEAILIPLGQYIAILQRLEYSPSAVYNMGVVNFLQMHPLLVLTFTVFAPVMMLYLFSFLNKRNSSDFYHSLPNTRLSLFFSFFAAVMTWVIAASVISSLTAVAGHLLLSQYCSINFTSVWVMSSTCWPPPFSPRQRLAWPCAFPARFLPIWWSPCC